MAQAKEVGPVFAWGNFVTILFNFIILAFIIFMMVKGMNNPKKKRKEETSTAPAAQCKAETLLSEIRSKVKEKVKLFKKRVPMIPELFYN